VKKVNLFCLLFLIISCSSKPNNSFDVPVVKDEKPDYLLRERYPNPAPAWAIDFYEFKKNAEKGDRFFYLGESGSVSDRISGCDLSSLEAKKKIAQQVASLITDKLASSSRGQLVINKENVNDPQMNKYFESTIASKSIAFIRGIQEYGQYWEERDYSISNGRKKVYECKTVVSISSDDLKETLQRSARNVEQSQEDPETKKIVKEALKDIDEQFLKYSIKN
jgi:hypothetical protein